MRFVRVIMFWFLASCGGDPPTTQRSTLVGAWRYADANQSCDYVFKNDGTFRAEVSFEGKPVWEFHGRWTVQDGMLRYKDVRDRLNQPPPGPTDPDRLLALQREYFLIEAADGSKRKYVRIQ